MNSVSETKMGQNMRSIKSDQGFTLIEILIAILILAVAIVPMLEAYLPALHATSSNEETMVLANQVRGTLDRVAALDFETLTNNQGDPVDLVTLFGSTEEAAKETFTLNGENYTPVVAITDASGGTGGLLQLTVTVSYVSLETLRAYD